VLELLELRGIVSQYKNLIGTIDVRQLAMGEKRECGMRERQRLKGGNYAGGLPLFTRLGRNRLNVCTVYNAGVRES